MEKILNADERIKKAENIYYRKKLNNNSMKYESATVNVGERKNYKLLRKIIVQLVICTIIYSFYYTVQNKENSFSQEIKNAIQNVLDYDMNYKEIKKNIEVFFNKKIVQDVAEEPEEKSNVIEETLSITDTNNVIEEVSSISEMEEDANFVKSQNSFIIPLEGTVTSRFGTRNPTTVTVPPYHTGIDIGTEEGKTIIAAMSGKVTQVSSQGDYRKSYKNRKWRNNYIICTLQNYLYKRRGYGKSSR